MKQSFSPHTFTGAPWLPPLPLLYPLLYHGDESTALLEQPDCSAAAVVSSLPETPGSMPHHLESMSRSCDISSS